MPIAIPQHGMYTPMEYPTAIKKGWNHAIRRDMDGTRDDATKWNKSDRERHIYDIAYIWNHLKNDTNMNLFIKEKQTNRYRKQIKGEEGW